MPMCAYSQGMKRLRDPPPKLPGSPLGSSATIISVRARCAGSGVPCISTQFHESQAIAIHVDSALTVILQPERQIDPQSEFQSSDSLACISIGMTWVRRQLVRTVFILQESHQF